jgi:hypothetical protein
MTNMDKKKWCTPRLRIFVRTKTEERVLANCKHSTPVFTGPFGNNSMCYSNIYCSNRCENKVGS